jgi:hypothetical protein
MASTKNEKPKADDRAAAKRRLTYAQYAAEKQISVDTVRRMAARGDLKVERIGRKCVRIIEATA